MTNYKYCDRGAGKCLPNGMSYKVLLKEFPKEGDLPTAIGSRLDDYVYIYMEVHTDKDGDVIGVDVDGCGVEQDNLPGDGLDDGRSSTDYENYCLSRDLLDLLSNHFLRLDTDGTERASIVLP